MLHESDDTVLGSLPAVVDAYKIEKFPWRDGEVKILCTGPTGSSALAALINMYSLGYHPVLESLDLPILTEDIIKRIAKLLVRASFNLQADIDEPTRAALVNVVDNPGTEFCISPTLLGPLNFDYSDAVFLFGILQFKLLHGWVLDSATPIYQEAKAFTRSGLSVYLSGIEDDEGQADNVMLVKGLLHAAENHQMTKCGFTSLFHEIADGELAIIFCHNRFNLVQRHADNLLMVETDIIVRKNFPDVQWRLFDGESLEDSLYLTESFTLVNGHEMTAKAHDWTQKSLVQIVQSTAEVPSSIPGTAKRTLQNQIKKKKRREKKLAEAASSQAATPDQIVQSTAEVPSSIPGTAERTLPPAEMKSEDVPSVTPDQIVQSTAEVPSSIPGIAERTLPPAEMKSEDVPSVSADQMVKSTGVVPSSIPGTAESTLPPAEMKCEAVPSVSADQIVKSTGVVPSSISLTDEETLLAENKSGVHAKSADKVLFPELGTLTSDFSGGKVVASLPNLDSDSSGDTPSGSIKMSSDETDKRTEEPEAKIAFDMDFLEFLINFRLNGIDYFNGILEAYKVTHKPWFFVPYEFILQHNERLALNIQDNYTRIYEELRESVVKYFKRNGLSCIDMKLQILGLPKAKSTQMFEDFIGSIKLHEVYQVSETQKDELPSFDGRRMCLGYLNCIIGKFKLGKCMAGKWTEAHMRVKNNGSEFVIESEEVRLEPDDGLADLLTFERVVLKRFANAAGVLPPYFDEFADDCLLFPRDCTPSERLDRFYQLISCPLALKPHLVRNTLVCEAYLAANSHTTGNPPQYVPLAGKNDCKLDWRTIASKEDLFQKIYDYEQTSMRRALRSSYFYDRWEFSHWSVLKYSRHFIQHVLRLLGLHNEKTIKDIAIVDILLSRKMGTHIARMVRYLVLECGVSNGIFSSPWRHYVASECLDGPLANIDATALDTLTSSDADKEMFAQVYSEVGISAMHKSTTLVSDANLADFSSILNSKGIKCQVHQNEILVASSMVARDGGQQYVRVYKPEGGPSSSSRPKAIIVEGPYCYEYNWVFESLFTWLKSVDS